MSENVSILDGSTFLVSDPNGDIDAKPDQPHGLFFKDMRHVEDNGMLAVPWRTDVDHQASQH